MNKTYTVILAVLQLLVGILASVYLIKAISSGSVTMSLIIAIPLDILGLLLGYRNVIKLKRLIK